jgi:hypothetical protein
VDVIGRAKLPMGVSNLVPFHLIWGINEGHVRRKGSLVVGFQSIGRKHVMGEPLFTKNGLIQKKYKYIFYK